MRLDNLAPPNLPLAREEYEMVSVEQHNNVLRLFFNRLSALVNALVAPAGGKYINCPYGAFYDTTTQFTAAANTATPILLNTTDLSNGVSVVLNSRITVAHPGVYDVQFSAQLDQTSGGVAHAFIWLRKNGVDVPNSASEVAVQGTTAEVIAAWNFVIALNTGDYVELVWSATSTNIHLKAAPAAAPVPAIPSVIVTVTLVSGT